MCWPEVNRHASPSLTRRTVTLYHRGVSSINIPGTTQEHPGSSRSHRCAYPWVEYAHANPIRRAADSWTKPRTPTKAQEFRRERACKRSSVTVPATRLIRAEDQGRFFKGTNDLAVLRILHFLAERRIFYKHSREQDNSWRPAGQVTCQHESPCNLRHS